MFYWNEDKEKVEELESEVAFLRMRSNLQADILEDLTARLDRYEQILLQLSKYGFKKDGTPKAKPGRKVGF